MESGINNPFKFNAVSNSFYWANGLDSWGYGPSGVGMRVVGHTTAVPLPGAAVLFPSSLFIVFVRRFRLTYAGHLRL